MSSMTLKYYGTMSVTTSAVRMFPAGTVLPRAAKLALIPLSTNTATIFVGDSQVAAVGEKGMPIPATASTIRTIDGSAGHTGGVPLLAVENLYATAASAQSLIIMYYEVG